ncbi:Alpha/Beta hydrolase protein, partial [Halteromyces radiatus]|uniref:Alpha/Beta hydrolase protein n=1 Tax=Halteromyces radiatus TaxID=101107 RepID=UPI00221EBA65
MIPGFKYLAFAFIVVLFGTRNGRVLLTQHCLKWLRNNVTLIPYPIRRHLCAFLFNMPTSLARLLLDFASQPQKDQLGWILKVQPSPTLSGHWIAPSMSNLTMESLKEAVHGFDIVILFAHGGGFTVGNSVMYMPSFQFIWNRLKQKHGLSTSIFSIEYPLPPTGPYPKAKETCLEAYQYLVHDLGISPTKIVLVGDSAGGNLMINTILSVRDQRTSRLQDSLPPLPLPIGCVLISPWVALHSGSPTYKSSKGFDVLTEWQLDRHLSLYLPDIHGLDSKTKELFLHQPAISSVYASFDKILTRFLITYSDREALQYDILRFIQKLQDDKVQIDVLSRSDQAHIWVIEPTLASSRDVWEQDLGKVTDWIADCCL